MSSLIPASSRYRTDMATIFDVFCEIGSPDDTGLPAILTKYPEDYNDETVLRSASGFAWDAAFYKILNHISLVMNNNTQAELDLLLTKIYHTDIPNVGDIMNFDIGALQLKVQIPDLARLPTLRDDKYMLEFFNAVNARQMIAIYASLLKERRIIFTSRKLSQLSSCIYAAATLIHPMTWQSVFIPVLPAQLIDMVMAPMPFLIGVPKQVLARTQIRELGDVVLVDLEEKKFQSAHDDVAALPTEVSSYLKKCLGSTNDMGDYLSRTFLRANVLLFGGYRLGFARNEVTGTVIWDKEKYVNEQRASYQPFLGSLIGVDGVQYLERFIEERLKSLNSGIPKNDEFEKEITNIERNRPQVKENATDVISTLKDKVTGIHIGSRLKLPPREIRKAKLRNWSLKRPSHNIGEPLSFDNVQWEETVSSGSSRTPSPANDDVIVANLIDLDSPVKPNEVSDPEFDTLKRNATAPQLIPASSPESYTTPSSLPSIQSLSKTYQVPFGQLPPIPPRPQSVPHSTNPAFTPQPPPVLSTSSSNPFIDPFATPDSTRTFASNNVPTISTPLDPQFPLINCVVTNIFFISHKPIQGNFDMAFLLTVGDPEGIIAMSVLAVIVILSKA